MISKIKWKKIETPKKGFSGYDYWGYENNDFSILLCPMINDDEDAKKGDYKLSIIIKNETNTFITESNLKKSVATKRAIDIVNRFCNN